MKRLTARPVPSSGLAVPLLSPSLMLGLALPAALIVGVLIAHKATLGAAVVLALGYGVVVLLDLPVALLLYVPLTFLQTVKFPGVGPSAIGLIILFAWLSVARSPFIAVRDLLRRHAGLLGLIIVLLCWNAATIVWAPNRGVAGNTLVSWSRSLLMFFLLATTITTVRDARRLLAAFVCGALLAILAGVLTGSLQTSAVYEGRLTGGAGDPNYLAMGIVAAAILAAALIATTRRRSVRVALVLSLGVLSYGFAQTQSRGGLIAAFAAAVCALILFKGHRVTVLRALAAVAVLAAIWFAANPSALSRVTTFSSGGDGRSDLWTVAGRVWEDHPILGVGLDNFISVEAQYVNRPGALTSVALIAGTPHVVHSVYIEALVDTGVIGFLLLVFAFGGLGRVALTATRRAQLAGDPELEILTKAVACAMVAVLVALIFLSDAPDIRIWELFALAPIMLRLTHTAPGAERAGIDWVALRAGTPTLWMH